MINLLLLNNLYPDAHCMLEYKKDYELLISVMLSAQTTDKKVNEVTKELYKYNLEEISKLSKEDIIKIIKPLGNYNKKSEYILKIANSLITNYQGIVPNDRTYLESLPGVGHKTTNLVLAELYNVPTFPVDTHVERIAKRLQIAKSSDSVLEVEHKLMKKIDQDKWIKTHHQMIYFGRNICKAQNPQCEECPFNSECKNKKKI